MTVPIPAAAPAVREVRRDTLSREIRLELADWRTRTGGVYDLPTEQQQALLLPGHLPHWGEFLPDFVIVLGTGDPSTVRGRGGVLVDTVTWRELRLHVGGVQVAAVTRPECRHDSRYLASTDWHSLDAIHGRLSHKPGAPGWLLALVRAHTPWGPLLDHHHP